eukprot:1018634-Ditylum_brightwellii.AAC.1
MRSEQERMGQNINIPHRPLQQSSERTTVASSNTIFSTTRIQRTVLSAFMITALFILAATSTTLASPILDEFKEADQINLVDSGKQNLPSPTQPLLRKGRRLEEWEVGEVYQNAVNSAAAPILPPLPDLVAHNVAGIVDIIQEGEIPFFWNVPMAGGNIVKSYYGGCVGKTLAAQEVASEKTDES